MDKQPFIYISYSHKDQEYLDELNSHLSSLHNKYDFELWSYASIKAGDDWQSQIDSALQKCDIAILLVSSDYLASEWVEKVELATLVQRAKKGITRIIPIILRSSSWAHTPLTYFQVLPRNGISLSELEGSKRDEVWSQLYESIEAELYKLGKNNNNGHIKKIITEDRSDDTDKNLKNIEDKKKDGKKDTKKLDTGKSEPINSKNNKNNLNKKDIKHFFISHSSKDGDFAEILKFRMKERNLHGWIDIDILEAGDDWRKEIDEAILKSSAIILILSPDSKTSEYVTYEWAFALGSGLSIIPLMLFDTPIHPRLEIFQYLDFTNRRARPWDKLLLLLEDAFTIEDKKSKNIL